MLDVFLDAATKVAFLPEACSYNLKHIISSVIVVQREVFLERYLGVPIFVLDVHVLIDAATKVAGNFGTDDLSN